MLEAIVKAEQKLIIKTGPLKDNPKIINLIVSSETKNSLKNIKVIRKPGATKPKNEEIATRA
jgi:hypothetical protein